MNKKKKYIKSGVALLCAATLLSVITPTATVVAAEMDNGIVGEVEQNITTPDIFSEDFDMKEYIEEDTDMTYVDDNTVIFGEDVVETTGYNKFTIQENDVEYNQEFFVDSNIVKINDMYYDLDQYIAALHTETATVTEALQIISPIELESSPKQDNTGTMQARATLPKTNYNGLKYVGVRKKINMAIVAIGAGAAALTAFFAPGAGVAIGAAFAKTVLSAAVKAGLISAVTQYFTTDVYYELYQATHKTVSGAIKEQRNPYTKIQTTKIWGRAFTRYFWSSRPY